MRRSFLESGVKTLKAIALVVSARKHGNCYDFAQFALDRLQVSGLETELVNFHDYQIIPCQRCDYECIQHLDPHKGTDAACPNYGGLPPALWFAFSQRVQGFFREAPIQKLKQSVVSAVVLAAPHQSSGAPWILSFIGDEVKGMDRKVAGFEVINPTEFEIEYTFDRLINEKEIQQRLEFLTDRTLKVARDIVSRIGVT